MTPMSHLMPLIIENIKVMIYSGQDDLICITLGLKLFVNHFDIEYIDLFKTAVREHGEYRQVAGYSQVYKNLRFTEAIKSGHMVPYSQPAHTRDMVTRFIEDYPFFIKWQLMI